MTAFHDIQDEFLYVTLQRPDAAISVLPSFYTNRSVSISEMRLAAHVTNTTSFIQQCRCFPDFATGIFQPMGPSSFSAFMRCAPAETRSSKQ